MRYGSAGKSIIVAPQKALISLLKLRVLDHQKNVRPDLASGALPKLLAHQAVNPVFNNLIMSLFQV
jgi:hypothetical protein